MPSVAAKIGKLGRVVGESERVPLRHHSIAADSTRLHPAMPSQSTTHHLRTPASGYRTKDGAF